MKKEHLISIIVAAIIVTGSAFYGGTIYAKSTGGRSTMGAGRMMGQASGAAGSAQQGGNRTFMGGAGGGAGRGGMMGGLVAGKIVSIDDKSITLELPSAPNEATHGSKIIFIADTSTIFKMSEGSKADLAPGTNVVITGPANADGSVTAQSIQIRPEGMTAPFGGMMRGAPGEATTTRPNDPTIKR